MMIPRGGGEGDAGGRWNALFSPPVGHGPHFAHHEVGAVVAALRDVAVQVEYLKVNFKARLSLDKPKG